PTPGRNVDVAGRHADANFNGARHPARHVRPPLPRRPTGRSVHDGYSALSGGIGRPSGSAPVIWISTSVTPGSSQPCFSTRSRPLAAGATPVITTRLPTRLVAKFLT